MKLTKREAYRLTIKFWAYLRDHPYTSTKSFRTTDLDLIKVQRYFTSCGLCQYFNHQQNRSCEGCPLDDCLDSSSPYTKWKIAKTPQQREIYANIIVEQVTAALILHNKKYPYKS